jgi:hypothetical protein
MNTHNIVKLFENSVDSIKGELSTFYNLEEQSQKIEIYRKMLSYICNFMPENIREGKLQGTSKNVTTVKALLEPSKDIASNQVKTTQKLLTISDLNALFQVFLIRNAGQERCDFEKTELEGESKELLAEMEKFNEMQLKKNQIEPAEMNNSVAVVLGATRGTMGRYIDDIKNKGFKKNIILTGNRPFFENEDTVENIVKMICEKNPNLTEEKKDNIAQVIEDVKTDKTSTDTNVKRAIMCIKIYDIIDGGGRVAEFENKKLTAPSEARNFLVSMVYKDCNLIPTEYDFACNLSKDLPNTDVLMTPAKKNQDRATTDDTIGDFINTYNFKGKTPICFVGDADSLSRQMINIEKTLKDSGIENPIKQFGIAQGGEKTNKNLQTLLDEEARALYSINLVVEKNKAVASNVATEDMNPSEINKAFDPTLNYNIKSDSDLKEFDDYLKKVAERKAGKIEI